MSTFWNDFKPRTTNIKTGARIHTLTIQAATTLKVYLLWERHLPFGPFLLLLWAVVIDVTLHVGHFLYFLQNYWAHKQGKRNYTLFRLLAASKQTYFRSIQHVETSSGWKFRSLMPPCVCKENLQLSQVEDSKEDSKLKTAKMSRILNSIQLVMGLNGLKTQLFNSTVVK